jgi:hypothetical protein
MSRASINSSREHISDIYPRDLFESLTIRVFKFILRPAINIPWPTTEAPKVREVTWILRI